MIQLFIMKTTKLILSAFVATTFLASCGGGSHEPKKAEEAAPEAQAEEASHESHTYTVDTEASNIVWSGEMLGIKTHTGNLKFKEGSVEAAGEQVIGGSFVVDLTTMSPTDANYDEEHTEDMLVGHLSSPDFFDVANYPEASFEVTSANGSTLTGNLTVRGITNEETVENVAFDAATKTFTGSMTFDRKKYDVAWESSMKDAVLSDDIKLEVSLAVK